MSRITNVTPNITEHALGYEIDLGLNWKLLEGWQFSVVGAYWAPGKWFSYACIDRSRSNLELETT